MRPVALLAFVLLALAVWRPTDAQHTAPATRWAYRSIPWTDADTHAVLRDVAGDPLADPSDIATSRYREHTLLDDPAIRTAVRARLDQRLAEAGQDGWEAYWILDETSLIGGVRFPSPTLLLKRPETP